MKLVLLGPPGAGKGTHAKLLVDRLGIPHISTGDIFRKNIKEGTPLGKKVVTYTEQGLLVPDELTTDLVLDRLALPDCARGYILDGFPRNLSQAAALTEALKAKGDEIDYAVLMSLDDETILRRMSGRRVCSVCGASYNIHGMAPQTEGVCDRCGGPVVQRKDDAPETVLSRLNVYREQTSPIIDYYRDLGKLVEIDAGQPLEIVFGRLMSLAGE